MGGFYSLSAVMSNTDQMRSAWAPACAAHPGTMSAAYRALDDMFRKWNYKPRAGVTGSYNCRRITGGTGYSLHAFLDGDKFTFFTGVSVAMAAAVDVNYDKNPYGPNLVTDMPRGMIDEIQAIRTGNGVQVWGWGGYYSGNKDAMHFELHCTAADLRSGVRGATLPAPPPVPDKVKPMFNPPLSLQPIVAEADDPDGGVYLLGLDGSLYAFGGAPAIRGANGQPWFDGRKGAQLESTGHGKVRITANTGETYNLPV